MKAAAALLVIVLSFSACEGGCGEAPKDSGSAQSSGQTVSGGSTGGGGGDAIPLTGGQRRQQKADENPLAAPKPETAPIKAAADVAGARVPSAGASGTAAPAASTPADGRVVSAAVMDVSPGDFDRLVLRNPKPVLMVYVTSSCRPCSKVEFELASMAQNYEGKVVFGRMDLNQSGATTLLPPGLRRLPLPALAFYRDGSPLNIRQNIPVPADSSALLKNWLKRVVDGRDVRLD